jgi:hypothetical protein
MKLRSIHLEYEDGTRRTLTVDQLALEMLAFFGRHHSEDGRCPDCNGVGMVDGKYCSCKLGRDLEKVEARSLGLP